MPFQNSEYSTPFNPNAIPSKSQVGSLAAEIAGEGYKVSEGTKGTWTPPPKQQMYPDWSKIAPIAHYFGRSDMQPWPSWIYHKTEQPRIVKDAEEAAQYGIIFREATEDERMIGQTMPRYDFRRGTEWRTQPWPGTQGFDVQKMGAGKNYEPPKPNYERAQHDMMGNLVAALQKGGTGTGSVDAETIAAIVAATVKAMQPAPADATQDADEEADRADLISIAEQRGVKVDKRWSTERLKAELAK